MVKMAAVLLTCGLAFAGTATAKNSDKIWYPMAKSQNGNSTYTYSAKAGSFGREGKTSFLIAQEKMDNTVLNGTSISYYKVIMTDQACDDGYGKVKYLTLDGKPAMSPDYLKDGESVASSIGDFICGVRDGLREQGKI
jgi:hypothetical protein